MKFCLIIIVLILSFPLTGQSQPGYKAPIDSTIAKQITISGFCLCQTKLSELQSLADDFIMVEVEEMNTPKDCIAQDSRYLNGQGYYSKNYPGLIFQREDEQSDYISKIRLTKDFKGKLPDGAYIQLADLKLRDVFEIYPNLRDKCFSRGCSDYWNFSNDTISFFVKIDKSIQPQYPFDEAFYIDKPVEAIDIFVSCYSLFHTSGNSSGQADSASIYYKALHYYNAQLDSLKSRSTEIFIENNDGITDKLPVQTGNRKVTVLTWENQQEIYNRNNNKLVHVKIFPAKIEDNLVEIKFVPYLGEYRGKRKGYFLSVSDWIKIQFKYHCTDRTFKYYKTVCGGI